MATRKKGAAAASQQTTTYALKLKGGSERRVTVPSHYKLTFGPTVPYERRGGTPENGIWALRFYDGDKLKAIFPMFTASST